MSVTGLLITIAGKSAIATDLGGGANLVLSHVAFGDANGVPYNPNVSQVALVNERYRATIASVAVAANEIIVDAVLPADTNDGSGRPSHSFHVAECGLFSSDGTLIGVARMSNGFKPGPSSGQSSIATFRLKLAVANPSAITVVIDPQAQVILGRHVRPFWMTVNGIQNAPPGSPALGDTYVIGDTPTGAWAGFPHRLAQWVGVWSLATAPNSHLVCDLSRDEGATNRFMRRTETGWTQAIASQDKIGFTRLATEPEHLAGTAELPAVPAYVKSMIAAAGWQVLATHEYSRADDQASGVATEIEAFSGVFNSATGATARIIIANIVHSAVATVSNVQIGSFLYLRRKIGTAASEVMRQGLSAGWVDSTGVSVHWWSTLFEIDTTDIPDGTAVTVSVGHHPGNHLEEVSSVNADSRIFVIELGSIYGD